MPAGTEDVVMRQVTPRLWIGSQPDPQSFAELKAQGIQTIINNRPDAEVTGQMTAAYQRDKATRLGIDYVHLPVLPDSISVSDVEEFRSALAKAEGPVFAHCRSGVRSLSLWAIAQVLDGQIGVSDLNALEGRMGLRLDGARAWLKNNRDGFNG